MTPTTRVVAGALAVLLVGAGGYYFGQNDAVVARVNGDLGNLAQRALSMVGILGARGAQPPQQPPAPPPPDVTVLEIKRADVPLTLTYPARIAGFRSVEIRSMVSGTIMKRDYEEGARVKQGDTLFRIDPRPYQATYDRATAQLANAKATTLQAEENFNRIQELSNKQVATPKQLDDARAARDQARAAVQTAEADIETAKLNLEFTIVKAPVSGPTALLSPPEGSIAQAQQTVLTTITQLDPAYVNFSTTENELREFRIINDSLERPLREDDITATIRFGDGATYPQSGRIIMSSQNVDLRTGTVQIRSVFPNAEGALLPGQFVRLIIKGITLPKAILIPQQAVSQGPQGTFVYVVNANSAAEIRAVKLDREVNSNWVVREGLNDGDRIIVDGVMRVRPNAPVKASPYAPKAADAGKPPASEAKK